MAIQTAPQYQLSFACTLAQYGVAIATTLQVPGNVIIAPQRFQGTYISDTLTTGQIDFSYDGVAWLKFYGANMTPAMITELTTTLAGTLGAPVPQNLANNPSYYNNV